MRIGEIIRFYNTVRHVRSRQLIARLHLTIRRKWSVSRASYYRDRLLSKPLPPLILRTDLPQPIFEPRNEHAVVDKGEYQLTFLNVTRTFNVPFDWHPPEALLWLHKLHYMEFLEGLPDKAFIEIIDDWIEQVLPYRPGYWRDDWNSYSLSLRCLVWMQQFSLRHQGLPEDFRERLLSSLYIQLSFLEENLEVDLGGNHLIKNIKTLMWAGRFFNTETAHRWYMIAEDFLEKELQEQILEGGMHYERSPAYHIQVFADLLECLVVIDAGEVKEKLLEVLQSMAQVLANFTHPDGYISLFNDGGLHMSYAPLECLQVWEKLSGKQVVPQRVFKDGSAGYFGYRSDSHYVLVDCGKVAPDFLTAHGHGDILAFEWTVENKRFIVDAGVYEYNPGAKRDHSRSTKAHNTVTLDGEDQCEFWGSFRMARRANVTLLSYQEHPHGFDLLGSHDGYRYMTGAPVHERAYSVNRNEIQVQDEIKGGDGQIVEARLLLHPECSVEIVKEDVIISRDDVVVKLETESVVHIHKSVWFPDFGSEVSCSQLVLAYGFAPCSGGFRLSRVK